MITIALDEYGDFEGIQQDKKPVYIAGVLYDDGGDGQETKAERRRLAAYYRTLIASVSDGSEDFSYPEALHSNGNKQRDHQVVRPVKQEVARTLPEFFQKGTYCGQPLIWTDSQGNVRQCGPRHGRYHVFVIIKSDIGMQQLLGNNTSILAKDDYASNLYFHMASQLIRRLIFQNPRIDQVQEVALDIATRSSGDMSVAAPLAGEYRRQGYEANLAESTGKVYFSLTNADVYRSIIAEEMVDTGKTDLIISDFHVTPIRYYSHAGKMEFLYLADSICSLLGFEMGGDNGERWLEEIVSRTSGLIGADDSLIFGYDEIDAIFSKAWAKYEDGDYYKALSIAFDGMQKEGVYARWYRQQWFPILEEKIRDSESLSDLNMSIRKLYETLNNNTLDQDKCLYIFHILEQLAERLADRYRTPEARQILYTLYDTGVTAYSHIGDSEMAELYFEKCSGKAHLVSLEKYLATRNKMVVFCCDYFQRQRAEELADENIQYLELLADIKQEIRIPGISREAYQALGKAYSQRGQIYAFCRDERAVADFHRSMEIFGEGSANYKISQSYLMHYYLECGDEQAYLEEAKAYFGGKTSLANQFQFILEEGAKTEPLINMKYALYVFLKGVYLLRREELSDNLWKKLQRAEQNFGKKIGRSDWKLTGHPAELIFKYMRLLAMERGEMEVAVYYKERMWNCLLYHGVTEDVVRCFGEMECAHVAGDPLRRNQLSTQLYDLLRSKFTAFTDLDMPEEGEERWHWLSELVNYMYR